MAGRQGTRTVFASPSRARGRKVSDEYTVPVCCLHHRELHGYGDEASWWVGVNIDSPLRARSGVVRDRHRSTHTEFSLHQAILFASCAKSALPKNGALPAVEASLINATLALSVGFAFATWRGRFKFLVSLWNTMTPSIGG